MKYDFAMSKKDIEALLERRKKQGQQSPHFQNATKHQKHPPNEHPTLAHASSHVRDILPHFHDLIAHKTPDQRRPLTRYAKFHVGQNVFYFADPSKATLEEGRYEAYWVTNVWWNAQEKQIMYDLKKAHPDMRIPCAYEGSLYAAIQIAERERREIEETRSLLEGVKL